MQTEFRAIVQTEYGAPDEVLRIVNRQLKRKELGADDVLVQTLSALPQGGPVEPIPEGTLRVPGLEGVGTILRLGATPC